MKEVIRVESSTPPTVEIDPSGSAYVRFKSNVKTAKTLVRHEWPHVAIDLDKNNQVIGIEAVGVVEFTITALIKKAAVQVPDELLDRARYISAKQAIHEMAA